MNASNGVIICGPKSCSLIELKILSQRTFNGINFSPNTLAMPFIPGKFVMSVCLIVWHL